MTNASTQQIQVTRNAEELARIHATCFEDSWSGLFFGSLLNQIGVIALAAEDKGFIVIRIVADEAEILTFAVHPTHRNCGIGHQLMEAALVLLMARNVTHCFLEVAEDNAAAIAVYQRAGFKSCGARPKYYQRDAGAIDALMMRRDLMPSTQSNIRESN